MHGLGLYIYAGEDLPEGDTPDVTPIIRKLEESKNVSELQTNWRSLVNSQTLPRQVNNTQDSRIYSQDIMMKVQIHFGLYSYG